MRIRLVIDLQYPSASTPEQEALIKHRLSAQVLSAARTKQFNVLALDEQETIKVDEIMVGCARVEEKEAVKPVSDTEMAYVAKEAVSIPVGADPNVYGDEDGDYWFASGHLDVIEMITAVRAWEAEVADPIRADEVDRFSHKHYYVVPDPLDDERYKVVEPHFPGAEPMTSIRRA